MRKPQAIIAALLTTAAILLPGQASAWQRPGHAAGAAMTYDELARTHPEVVRKIVEIAAGHPDRARFDAALGEAKGAERDRRLFMEMARWPDDVRESPYDHPAWHYWMNPYSSPVAPPPHPPHGTIGEAREAFALNLAVARDESVALRERAMALCWVIHILQDLHQPLHAAQLFSAEMPDGDRGGSKRYVRAAPDAQATTFHRFWDERVLTATATVDEMEAKGRDMAAAYPRAALSELKRPAPADKRIETWAREETLPLARTLAYDGGKMRTGETLETAPVPPADYLARSKAASERRLAIASYRLADVLAELYGDRPGRH